MLNSEELFKILPQRYPFVLIDRVIELLPQKKAVALKNVSFNEEFFGGHFPGRPVMPAALIIEAMSQTAIVLLSSQDALSRMPVYYLGSVKVRFLHPVHPGDQLKISVEPVKIITGAAIVSAVASVNDQEVAKGELSFSAS